MKVAILTLPLRNYNYGGILQCYALQTVLSRMNHETIILNRTYYSSLLSRLKNFVLTNILHDTNRIAGKIKQKQIDTRNLKISYFIDNNINLSRPITNTTQLKKFIKKHKIDLVIIGSDQVWRPDYAPNIFDYFGGFVSDDKNTPIIAYAASFGVNDTRKFDKETLTTCAKLIKKFKAISVRELSGVKICKDDFNIEAIQLPDPTLLLNNYDYRQLYEKANTLAIPENLLIYILDQKKEITDYVVKFSDKNKLTPFWINRSSEEDTISIEQWLRYFDEAKFIITDSFHGCVFSIIFNKPFYVICNNERGEDRFKSLLTDLALTDNIIDLDAPSYILHDALTINENKLNAMKSNAMKFLASI